MDHFITIKVSLGARSYPLYIASNLLSEQQQLLQSYLPAKQVLIVTNETIAPYYLSKLQQSFQSVQCDTLILPDGEQYKTLDTLNMIFNKLLEKNHDKKTLLCALGGGVIGDLTGFAAACYRRGVAFIQVPTTLLAQADAAIGGKTAVNHPLGKNMIGAIYQPKAVFIDITTLATLPDREYKAGLAEVIKYSLIQDKTFFIWLEQHVDAILARETESLIWMLQTSCTIKAKIVARDETEMGERALLNLGHTFAHALETLTHYQTFLHGEAVAIGLYLAANLSQLQGWLSMAELQRIGVLLKKFDLPTQLPPKISAAEMLTTMRHDKKVLAQKMNLVLLKEIGQATLTSTVSETMLQDLLSIPIVLQDTNF